MILKVNVNAMKLSIETIVATALQTIMYHPFSKKMTIFFAFLYLCCAASSWSQEVEVTLSTTVVGNQEQPKVLYIVPWKPVGESELENQTIESQLDLVFGHVERVELRRELKYLEQLSGSSTTNSGN